MPAHTKQILAVDDDSATRELVSEILTREGFGVAFAPSGDAALAMMLVQRPDLLLSDIQMKNGIDGLSLLKIVRREYPAIPVVLMTAFGSIDTAVTVIKEGAFDYISKPFDAKVLLATVRRAVANGDGKRLASFPDDEEGTSGLIGRTSSMLEVYKMIARVSDSPAAVLVSGESGTGKELVARAIHKHGVRAAAPFVPVNCGALTETLLESELFGHVKGAFTGAIANKRGIFEQAEAGTVFLDEISETSPGLQVKLLRVLQEREVVPVGSTTPIRVGARVIAASNADLEKLSASAEFRQDLLYRLNVIQLRIPPLRERREDIPLLAAHFLRKHVIQPGASVTIEQRAMRCLTEYSWPGNVRELENVIERAVTLSRRGVITIDDLPAGLAGEQSNMAGPPVITSNGKLFAGLPTLDEVERRYLLHVLNATGNNRKRAAEILGIHRKTLYRMADRFEIEFRLGVVGAGQDAAPPERP